MVSDSELVTRLQEILRSSDLNTATAGSIRRQLETEFDVTLNDKKSFIRDQIDVFINTHFSEVPQNDDVAEHEQPPKEEEEEEEGNENEEKEEEEEDNGEEEKSEVEEEEEVEESDEEGSKKKRPDENVKRKGGGFSKPCALSPQLQELVGEPELARTEVVKRMWAYIKEKNLQNPSNKKKIICDDILRGIFRVDTVDMFKMNKLLSKHVWPIETEYATPVTSSSKAVRKKQDGQEGTPVTSSSKAVKKKQERQEDVDEPKQKVKRQKGQGSGFLAPLQLSDALAKFIGTGESELSRADVVKRMWKYIKENELQDPSDKRKILCDDKLKELFKLDSFTGFTMTKHLTAHFIKSS